jgi:hypothetical protein
MEANYVGITGKFYAVITLVFSFIIPDLELRSVLIFTKDGIAPLTGNVEFTEPLPV